MKRLLIVFLTLVCIIAILNINNNNFDFSFESYLRSIENSLDHFPEFPNISITWTESSGTSLFEVVGNFFGNLVGAVSDIAKFTLYLAVYPFRVIIWLVNAFAVIFTQPAY